MNDLMRKILFTLIILTAPGLARADNGVQNLLGIYRQALESDPAWAAAQNANVAAQEKQVQGRALLLPTAGVNAEARHNSTDATFGNSVFGGGRQNFETYSYSVNVSQPLFRRQNSIQYEQSKVQVTQADEQLNAARQDLMLRVTQAYFEVLLAQDKVELLGGLKAANYRQLEQAKANFDVGAATITDVKEAQARHDLTLANEIGAINELEVKKRAVESITGQLPGRLATAKSEMHPNIPEPRDMEQWSQIALQNNLALKIQQDSLKLATQQVDYAKAANLPTLDAVGGYTDTHATGSVNGYDSDVKDWRLGVQFQVPLYQGGAINSREREAIGNKEKARDDVETARRTAERQTRQSYLDVTSAVAQISAYEQALVSSKSQLDSTNLGYEVGVRTSVDVLNAQQQYFTAKRDLLQARYNWLTSIIKLKAASGVLTENDLAETNRMLEGS